MIIKIIGLSLLAIAMYGLGYVCGVIMTGLEYEEKGDRDDSREILTINKGNEG